VRTPLALSVSIVVAMLNVPVILAQTQPPKPAPARTAFEVASIRPSAPMPPSGGGGNGRSGGPGVVSGGCGIPKLTMDKGRVDYACISLTGLVGYAFGIPQSRISGPDWMMAQTFDVVAKLPAGASESQVPEMFQTLLADRFKLAIHRENKEQPVYGLVVAKSGLKLKEATLAADAPVPDVDQNAPPCPPQSFNCRSNVVNLGGVQTTSTPLTPQIRRISSSRIGTALFTRVRPGEQGQDRLEAPNTTLEGLADLLTIVGQTGLPVTDLTGVKGHYQVILEISTADAMSRARADAAQAQSDGPAAAPADSAANRVFAALQEALKKVGLQLEPRKGPIQNLIVDHVEKTPTEN
jgi:uncharacterized protein (TIGR03435 family)